LSTKDELVDDRKEADRRLNAANALVTSAEQQLSILNSHAEGLESTKGELENLNEKLEIELNDAKSSLEKARTHLYSKINRLEKKSRIKRGHQ
jgi:chromosome segregation ATPase